MSQYHSKSTDKRGGVSGSFNLRPLEGLEIDAVTGIDFLLNEALTLVPSTSIAEREMGAAVGSIGCRTWKINKRKKYNDQYFLQNTYHLQQDIRRKTRPDNRWKHGLLSDPDRQHVCHRIRSRDTNVTKRNQPLHHRSPEADSQFASGQNGSVRIRDSHGLQF